MEMVIWVKKDETSELHIVVIQYVPSVPLRNEKRKGFYFAQLTDVVKKWLSWMRELIFYSQGACLFQAVKGINGSGPLFLSFKCKYSPPIGVLVNFGCTLSAVRSCRLERKNLLCSFFWSCVGALAGDSLKDPRKKKERERQGAKSYGHWPQAWRQWLPGYWSTEVDSDELKNR